MTVIELAERLLRLPEFAMQMEVTIRDAVGVDHADIFGTAKTAPRLNFEFVNSEDEVIWRLLGGQGDE